MLLAGKSALVTGGSRGIGKAIVCRFLGEGANVYFVSKNASPHYNEMKEIADRHNVRVIWKQGDVTDEQNMEELTQSILKESGNIEILVNNAGITRDGLIFRMKSQNWKEVLETNLTSVFYLCKSVSRIMIKQRAGTIINISSIVGILGNPGQTNYAASKAGIIGFSKSLAKEVASRGVRVNIIAPGYIETDMTAKLKDNIKTTLLEQIPLGRIGSPDEVANTALFLATDLSTYITGHTICVDGGLGMQ